MSSDGAPPIADYGVIGDCHSAALISRHGSIDWCCLPRFDSGSCFGRLLDWERGGHCSIDLGDDGTDATVAYLDGTMVLQTTFRAPGGEAVLTDCFVMRPGGAQEPRRELLRVLECRRGSVQAQLEIVPRFDYGELTPWLRRQAPATFSAIGGNDGLIICSDAELEALDGRLLAQVPLRGGERLRVSLRYVAPDAIERSEWRRLNPDEIDDQLEQTIAWWQRWSGRIRFAGPDVAGVLRSALVLKALTYAPSGAIAAAPTTSLPETPGGKRNWDYRYSWIRDSTFSVRALGELGAEAEAAGFHRFIMRSSAGHAEHLQIVYGVGGERRLIETELDGAGYHGARPIRIGNGAAQQVQLDALGEVVNLAWRWHRRGHSPDDDEWRFLCEIVEMAIARWREPDRGIWEWRGQPRHFVHSKAGCWAAVDRGLRLAADCMRRAPLRRWRQARNQIREAIERHGYDRRRGIFVQAFDGRALDAALLLLPVAGFIDWQDERMVRTTDAVREKLDADGLLYRHREDDGLPGQERAFLPCSFWLVECLARQGRAEEARSAFDRAMMTANDLGLFSEECDPATREMLGNFPQGLTHLSHIAAAHALAHASLPESDADAD